LIFDIKKIFSANLLVYFLCIS